MTGEELKKIREDNGLKKSEFANAIGIAAMLEGRYESGSIVIPDSIAEKVEALYVKKAEETSEKPQEAANEDTAAAEADRKEMGEKIKALRKSQKLSQTAFSQRIEVSRSSLSFYEAGKVLPTDAVLEKIRNEFGENWDQKAEEPDEKKKKARKPRTTKKPKTDEKAEAPEKAETPEKAESAENVEKPKAKRTRVTMKTDTGVEKKKGAAVATKKTPAFYIQALAGGVITPDEVLKKIPADVDSVYVKPEENKAYWVKGDESGAVELW